MGEEDLEFDIVRYYVIKIFFLPFSSLGNKIRCVIVPERSKVLFDIVSVIIVVFYYFFHLNQQNIQRMNAYYCIHNIYI